MPSSFSNVVLGSFPDSKSSAGIKMEVKQEVKTEIKSEESSPLPATPIRVHPATGLPTKEEEYDSSATVSLIKILWRKHRKTPMLF